MHLVGFVVKIYHDARSAERQSNWLINAVRGVTVHQDIMAVHTFSLVIM